MTDFENEPVRIEIDGTLDLHHFSPKDIKFLVPDYIEECSRLGIMELRIIHGKGKGILRRSVHSILSSLQQVESFRLASEDRGNWGATIVILKKAEDQKK